MNRCKHTPEAEPTACQRKAGAQRVEGTCPGPQDQRAAAEVKSGRAWHSCNVTICNQRETVIWFPEGAGLIGLTQVNYLLGKRDDSGCLVTKTFWWGRAWESSSGQDTPVQAADCGSLQGRTEKGQETDWNYLEGRESGPC